MVSVKLALLALVATASCALTYIEDADEQALPVDRRFPPQQYWSVPAPAVPGVPLQQSTKFNVHTVYGPNVPPGLSPLGVAVGGEESVGTPKGMTQKVFGRKPKLVESANGSEFYGSVEDAIASPAENKLVYVRDAFGHVRLVAQRKGKPVDVATFLDATELRPASIAGENGAHFFSLDGSVFPLKPGCTIVVNDARVFPGSEQTAPLKPQPWAKLQLEIRCPVDNSKAKKIFK